MKLTGMALLILGLAVPSVSAQLGDVAREQRAARNQARQSGPRITTEGAEAPRNRASVSVAGVAAPAPTAEDDTVLVETPDSQPEAVPEAASPASLGEDEDAWRQAFADARAEVQRSGEHVALAEEELADLNNQLLTRGDVYNREYQILPLITAKEEELAQARQHVGEANQAVQALETALRRANLPAGWAR